MSYDLTIQKTKMDQADADLIAAKSFIGSLPGIKTKGDRGFVYQPGTDMRMEIDLEYVDVHGDSVSNEAALAPGKVNRVHMHIPAAYYSDIKLGKYLDVSKKITDHLHWRLIDEQERTIAGTERPAPSSVSSRPNKEMGFWIMCLGLLVIVVAAIAGLLRKRRAKV